MTDENSYLKSAMMIILILVWGGHAASIGMYFLSRELTHPTNPNEKTEVEKLITKNFATLAQIMVLVLTNSIQGVYGSWSAASSAAIWPLVPFCLFSILSMKESVMFSLDFLQEMTGPKKILLQVFSIILGPFWFSLIL